MQNTHMNAELTLCDEADLPTHFHSLLDKKTRLLLGYNNISTQTSVPMKNSSLQMHNFYLSTALFSCNCSAFYCSAARILDYTLTVIIIFAINTKLSDVHTSTSRVERI